MQQTLMKDARRGLHSLVEDIPPEGSLLEVIEHSPAQVLNLYPSTQPSHDTWRNMTSLGAWRKRRYAAGALRPYNWNPSPRRSTAQARRAFFAAIATTAFQ